MIELQPSIPGSQKVSPFTIAISRDAMRSTLSYVDVDNVAHVARNVRPGLEAWCFDDSGSGLKNELNYACAHTHDHDHFNGTVGDNSDVEHDPVQASAHVFNERLLNDSPTYSLPVASPYVQNFTFSFARKTTTTDLPPTMKVISTTVQAPLTAHAQAELSRIKTEYHLKHNIEEHKIEDLCEQLIIAIEAARHPHLLTTIGKEAAYDPVLKNIMGTKRLRPGMFHALEAAIATYLDGPNDATLKENARTHGASPLTTRDFIKMIREMMAVCNLNRHMFTDYVTIPEHIINLVAVHGMPGRASPEPDPGPLIEGLSTEEIEALPPLPPLPSNSEPFLEDGYVDAELLSYAEGSMSTSTQAPFVVISGISRADCRHHITVPQWETHGPIQAPLNMYIENAGPGRDLLAAAGSYSPTENDPLPLPSLSSPSPTFIAFTVVASALAIMISAAHKKRACWLTFNTSACALAPTIWIARVAGGVMTFAFRYARCFVHRAIRLPISLLFIFAPALDCALMLMGDDNALDDYESRKYKCRPFNGRKGMAWENFKRDFLTAMAQEDDDDNDLDETARGIDIGGANNAAGAGLNNAGQAPSAAQARRRTKRNKKLYSFLYAHVIDLRLREAMAANHQHDGAGAFSMLEATCGYVVTDLELFDLDAIWDAVSIRNTIGISADTVTLLARHLSGLNARRPVAHRKFDDDMTLKLLSCFTHDIDRSLALEVQKEIRAQPGGRLYETNGHRDFSAARDDLDDLWRAMFTAGAIKPAPAQLLQTTGGPRADGGLVANFSNALTLADGGTQGRRPLISRSELQGEPMCYVCRGMGHISDVCPSKPAFRPLDVAITVLRELAETNEGDIPNKNVGTMTD